MTVSSTTNRKDYTGNGVTTAFATTFPFLLSSDLKVYKDGTLQTITTHYTVSGGSGSTGTVTFLTAPANGLSVVIVRDPALTQGLDLVENDPLPAEELEKAYDKLTMIAQRLDDKVSRALVMSDTSVGTFDLTLPAASAGKALKWNVTEDGLENSTYDPDEQATLAAAQVALAAAQVTLAQGHASDASGYATAAGVSAAAAAASYDAFDDRYLGSKAADPTLDNDGNALLEGALYWNTATKAMRVYNGATWSDVAASTSFSVQMLSGTGAQTAFTLTNPPTTVNALMVYISGVRQVPTTDYTLSGTTLTFTSAPPSGTNNILTVGISSHDIGTPSDGTVTMEKLASDTLEKLSHGFKNKIINGSFQIWQRGTSFTNQKVTSGNTYACDRWIGNRATDANGQTITRVAGTAGRQQYGMKWQRAAGDANTGAMYQFYAIASADCYGLIGKQVTLSFAAKAGANYSGGDLTAQITYGTGTDQREYAFTGKTDAATLSQAITTTSTTYTLTTSAIIPTSATQVGVEFVWTPSGTAGADDSITLEEVQLEAGPVATPFESRPYGTELALCQRYYYRVTPEGANDTISTSGTALSTTTATCMTQFPVTMRIIPALEQSGVAGDYTLVRFGAATATACSSVPTIATACSVHTGVVTYTVASGLTNGYSGYATSTATAGYLGFNAEL